MMLSVDDDMGARRPFDHQTNVFLARLVPSLRIGEGSMKHSRDRRLNGLHEDCLVLGARQISVTTQIFRQVLEREVWLVIPDVFLKIPI
jgi:hypothetical protein